MNSKEEEEEQDNCSHLRRIYRGAKKRRTIRK
jgi:hypothetical protein